MANCSDYISADDLKTGKQAVQHIEHVAKSKNANGAHALTVTDTIRGEQVTNLTLDGMETQFQTAQEERETEFNDQMTQQEFEFQQFLLNSGYRFLGDYENGPYIITARNQIIRYQNEFWRLNAATNPPYTTTGVNSTSWAVDVTHLVSVGDATLRQDLAAGTVTIGNQNTVTVAKGLFYIIPNAIGDGVADDTLAVQDAINRCAKGVLVIPPGKKYRCRNLTVPHPMAFWSAARRLDTWLEPYGNDGGTIHSGDFIKIKTTGTVSFFNISLEARHVTLSYVDGQRLNGVNGGDNTSGVYQSGFAMYNCSVSGFSGINIRGGNNKSFGTISSNTQSESSGLSCIVINGVDWRIDHAYVGRSKERHGIEVYGQSNAITHCDSYFNYRDGIAYEVTTGNVLISIENCVVNSNGENGIRISGPYQQQGGCKVINNKIWNNSKNSDGVYHNIDINHGRGHQVHGNLHYEYTASADAGGSPRCAFCLNLRGGATLSGAWNDSVDPLYSYRSGAINVETQTVTNQDGYKIGSGVDFSKGITNDTRIGFSVKINGESFPRVEIAAGAVKLGNGASATSHGIQQLAAYPNVTMGIKGLGVTGEWNLAPLRIGTFRLWSDGSGNLRVKKGSDPTSATDGVILTSA